MPVLLGSFDKDGNASKELDIRNQFFALHKRMTSRRLQYCSGDKFYANYSTSSCNDDSYQQNRNIKASDYDQLELSYTNQLNIIAENICKEYCSRYNNMYDINFIAPLWFMIFQYAYASEQYGDILLLTDCSKYLMSKDKRIKNALLNIIDISFQLSQCERIQYKTVTNKISNSNSNENSNDDDDYDMSNKSASNECETFVSPIGYGWFVSLDLVKFDLKTIKHMIKLAKEKNQKCMGSWVKRL